MLFAPFGQCCQEYASTSETGYPGCHEVSASRQERASRDPQDDCRGEESLRQRHGSMVAIRVWYVERIC
jgi:hypothetical protein